jgi:hypothetical protein
LACGRRVWAECVFWIGDDGQRLIVYLDEEAGIRGNVATLGQHDSNGVTSITGNIYRQRAPLGLPGAGHGHALQRRHLAGKLPATMHRDHTGNRGGQLGGDRADARVRIRM